MSRAAIIGALVCASFALGCRSEGGDLTVEQLSAVVAQEQASLEPCYQQGLERTPYKHEFRVQAELRIRPDGSVETVKLDQTGLQGLGPCLTKALFTWRFPEAKESTRASLPIVFQPKVEQVMPDHVKLPPGFRVLNPGVKH
ncbi:MAG: AgmX/PglI C-terminal domain-containing protein [Polyangiales bacterium]